MRVNSSDGGEVSLQSAINAAGLSFVAGDQLKVRMQVTGTSPTTIRAKVRKLGTTEPATWRRSITDATIHPNDSRPASGQGARSDPDQLGIHKLVHAVFAQLPTYSGSFHPAER